MQQEQRSQQRDSLLLSVDLRLENDARAYRVKMRNLSSQGMMGVGSVDVIRGTRLQIDFREAGKVWGNVAWREGNRFGIAFEQEVDPAAVRVALADNTVRQDNEPAQAPRPIEY